MTGATLNGTVNPEGANGTCFFLWGTNQADLSNEMSCTPSSVSGASSVPVSLDLSGQLTEGTTYFYQLLFIINGVGTTGNELQFNTQVIAGPATNMTQTTATLTGTVNPEGSSGFRCVFEWGTLPSDLQFSTDCAQQNLTGNSPVAVSADIPGGAIPSLSPNTTYYYKIAFFNPANGQGPVSGELSFSLPPPPPTATTGPASSVSTTSGTLNAAVNPNGGTVTSCQFNWGTTTGYGHSVLCAQSPGGGLSVVPLTASLSGLTPNTTYHFQIVSTNAGGTSTGLDQTMTTGAIAPTVLTGGPALVSQTGATLNATVNPNASNVTTCRFDWGTTTKYGNTVPCDQSVGAGTSPVPVSAGLSGLKPNTPYHYRVISTNGAGTSVGLDQTVRTAAVPPPVAGRSFNLGPLSGIVLVKLPGTRSFILVGGLEQVPVGTIVDATRGVVTVFAAKTRNGQIVSGQAWGALFRITQQKVSGNWLTVLKITGPALTGCRKGAADVARSRPRHRALWMRDPGFFETVGKFASAIDHAMHTKWMTEDTCTGTLIKAALGSVKLDDFPHHHTFILKAHHSFFAHPGNGG